MPTPISADGHLLVSTENNGTREYQFKDDGQIDPLPVGEYADLVPDAHSPIVVGGRLFGISGELFCLDAGAGLKPLWTASDEAFSDYTSLIGSPTRVLITTLHGELLLIDSQSPNYRLVSRARCSTTIPAFTRTPARGHASLRPRQFVSCLLRLGRIAYR